MSHPSTTERPEPGLESQPARAFHEELRSAKQTIQALEHEVRKAGARYEELDRAYQKTVRNLVQVTETCARLKRERDEWRIRTEQAPSYSHIFSGALRLSQREVATIRKAMARLHHPDVGGDAERMRAWNTLLDALAFAAPEERR